MKKRLKWFIFCITIITNILLLSGCSNNNEEQLLKDKLTSEIQYFDSTISNMLNKANGLKLDNYKVISKKIEDKKQNDASSSGQSDGGSSSSRF